MIKTLSQALRMDKERFKVPRSVQQAIPIQRIWPDGVFQSGTKFSKTFRFSDINYAIAGKEDKTEMFLDYSELLNALDSGAAAKITLNNRQINKEEFEKSKAFIDKVDFYETHIFKYSKREGTKAAVMDNQIPEQIKTARSNELLELGQKKRIKYEEQFVGTTVEVLMEEQIKIDGENYQVGHTKEYVKVALKTEANLQNKLVDIQIDNHSQIIH